MLGFSPQCLCSVRFFVQVYSREIGSYERVSERVEKRREMDAGSISNSHGFVEKRIKLGRLAWFNLSYFHAEQVFFFPITNDSVR